MMQLPSEEELKREILQLKDALGTKLFIAAHHYQRPEVVEISDCIGDSYKLAVEAAKTSASYILLCGVRFMAESAAILARSDQLVICPDLRAGCPMADMISLPRMMESLDKLNSLIGRSVVPLTYMNSYADVKSLTGEREGVICTSSNAEKILSYYVTRQIPVFFSPDFNLGINTAKKIGVPLERIFKISREGMLTSLVPDESQKARKPEAGLLFLWDGYCHVHRAFTVEDVQRVRSQYKGIQVIVHPECDPAVVAASDGTGSTEGLYRMLKDAPTGSAWAVGTESHFVLRAAKEFPEKSILPLRESFCPNMARINLESICSVLRNLMAVENGDVAKRVLPVVTVSPFARAHAAAALRRMIELTEQ
ncbi:MAG: quinolinate synthase NadA [Treponemataceae bacterium]|nr:quinolinate synthase NadA [Treponemataceae bacterium]